MLQFKTTAESWVEVTDARGKTATAGLTMLVHPAPDGRVNWYGVIYVVIGFFLKSAAETDLFVREMDAVWKDMVVNNFNNEDGPNSNSNCLCRGI